MQGWIDRLMARFGYLPAAPVQAEMKALRVEIESLSRALRQKPKTKAPNKAHIAEEVEKVVARRVEDILAARPARGTLAAQIEETLDRVLLRLDRDPRLADDRVAIYRDAASFVKALREGDGALQ